MEKVAIIIFLLSPHLTKLALFLPVVVLGEWNATYASENWKQAILGVAEAPTVSFPYQVSLQENGSHFCGGSIIDSYFVITAAHCCFKEISLVDILAGVNNIAHPLQGAQRRGVAEVIVHPGYSSWFHENDVCLLKLREPLILGNQTRTEIIHLPPEGYSASGNATVSGWGAIYDGGPGSSKLLSIEVPIVSDDQCSAGYGSDESIKDSMICAGTWGKDSCKGDSGGPLVDSKRYLVGIVSWGRGCGRGDKLGVYTEVSYFVTWVENAVLSLR